MNNLKFSQQTSNSLIGFLPAVVIQYLLSSKDCQILVPAQQTFKSVVMVADISGFTKLAESISKLGQESSEVLAFAINRYMELLVKFINRSGGDIFKYAGDTVIAIWPPPPIESDAAIEFLCRQALQSALDIQTKLNDTNILEDIKFQLKIGFGVGEISIMYVGGVFNRCEFLALGDALNQAYGSQQQATRGGQTIISTQVQKYTGKYFNCEDVGDFIHFFVKSIKLEKNLKQKIKMRADALMIKNNIKLGQFEKISKQLITFLPAALIPYVLIDQERWSAELRRLTLMIVKIKVNNSLEVIQKLVNNLQKTIYFYQGSLNKLNVDETQSLVLIIIFGLPPMSHFDDPLRAILTAQVLVSYNQCQIGIATGTVYAGVVGASGSRREYSVLGDAVNTAVRFMQAAPISKILIDEETAKEASFKIDLKPFKKIKIKGKSEEVQAYEPEETIPKIRINNPFFPNNPMRLYYVDRNIMLDTIRTVCEQYLLNGTSKQFVIELVGPFGSGKSFTLFMVLTSVEKKITKPLKNVIVNMGPNEKMLRFNGIRQLIQQLQRYSDQPIDKELLETKQFSVLKTFPNAQTTVDKAQQKEVAGLVIKIITNFLTQNPQTRLILCFDDFQYYDHGSLRAIKSIVKQFQQKILIIILMRDSYMDEDYKQSQLGLVAVENSVPQECLLQYRLSGLQRNQEKDSLIELIEKEYKIKEFTLESNKISKNIVGAILKSQSKQSGPRRTLGVRQVWEVIFTITLQEQKRKPINKSIFLLKKLQKTIFSIIITRRV